MAEPKSPRDRLKDMLDGMYKGDDLFGGLFGLPKPQVVSCRGCQQKNRVDVTKLSSGKVPRCGKCGLPIPVATK
jgi:hypothetical protein